ncbi:MAG: HD domain-containing protein [Treponema sp.]|nr:HD domain-containing protein [Treponema sp.]MCL2251396.1 HD domain-containing protein [Treponema sp.]
MKSSIEASLIESYTHPVRDVLWGHIYMTDKFASLTESSLFRRLNRIMQLGPVYLVYPGATHTRASHSIGVYHIGRRLLQNLTERGASAWLTHEGVKSFLAACLLHDLGHFPYTHSLKELSLSSHEALTAAAILKEPLKSLVGEAGADPALTAAIVDKEMASPVSDELLFYRKLLSGALDPDKLDYLNRDARFCGVPYGAQDVDFILSRLYPDKERGADIDSKLIPNVEAVLFSKYLMYRTVYWHRQVRAATAMVKKALITGLVSGDLSCESLYNLDDTSLFSLLSDSERIKTCKNLVEAVREGVIYGTAAEISYEKADLSNPAWKNIRDINKRAQFEEKLAQELRQKGLNISGEDIIIDIPEPVSFETGLFVLDEGRNFSDSSSAFKTETVNAFIETLYTIRIYINQKYNETIKTFLQECSILNKIFNSDL